MRRRYVPDGSTSGMFRHNPVLLSAAACLLRKSWEPSSKSPKCLISREKIGALDVSLMTYIKDTIAAMHLKGRGCASKLVISRLKRRVTPRGSFSLNRALTHLTYLGARVVMVNTCF
jgi:hypothetical protein